MKDYNNSIKNRKIIEAISYLLSKTTHGLTQYQLIKMLFIADKDHLSKYARTITRDDFVAMPYGPVGSRTRDILKLKKELPDVDIKYFSSLVSQEKDGNIITYKINKKSNPQHYERLSASDRQILDKVFIACQHLSFQSLKNLTHKLPEWKKHEKEVLSNNTSCAMPLVDLLDEPIFNDTTKDQLSLCKELIECQMRLQIPPNIIINNISDWKVLYFKDRTKGSSCPPHFHIVIPTIQKQYLVLCLISTKIDQRKLFYSPAGEEKYLVQVSHDTLSCLTKESVVDCPGAELLDRETLLGRIEELNNLKTADCEVSTQLRAQIKKAITNSAIVEDIIKKRIK